MDEESKPKFDIGDTVQIKYSSERVKISHRFLSDFQLRYLYVVEGSYLHFTEDELIYIPEIKTEFCNEPENAEYYNSFFNYISYLRQTAKI